MREVKVRRCGGIARGTGREGGGGRESSRHAGRDRGNERGGVGVGEGESIPCFLSAFGPMTHTQQFHGKKMYDE